MEAEEEILVLERDRASSKISRPESSESATSASFSFAYLEEEDDVVGDDRGSADAGVSSWAIPTPSSNKKNFSIFSKSLSSACSFKSSRSGTSCTCSRGQETVFA